MEILQHFINLWGKVQPDSKTAVVKLIANEKKPYRHCEMYTT